MGFMDMAVGENAIANKLKNVIVNMDALKYVSKKTKLAEWCTIQH